MPFLSCSMSKYFLRNTNNTDRDSVDKLKTHIQQTLRER